MGKYDNLKGKLSAFQQEPQFQEKVNQSKNDYLALSASELVRSFGMIRNRKKDMEEQISDVNVELEALSQLLNENFEASGVSKITLSTGETCYQQTEPCSSVSDRTALLSFIKKQRLQNLLSLQWQTMNAMNKERLVAGKPPLPGTQVFLKTSVRLKGAMNSHEE